MNFATGFTIGSLIPIIGILSYPSKGDYAFLGDLMMLGIFVPTCGITSGICCQLTKSILEQSKFKKDTLKIQGCLSVVAISSLIIYNHELIKNKLLN